uniref:Secreted protein n=1 Tax=Setaria viridis TaxID=4556 RepID=A0A4U6ST98_SETVI|nr:hypothetical protein SEVIR_9G094550v2 [Setaria viridis]
MASPLSLVPVRLFLSILRLRPLCLLRIAAAAQADARLAGAQAKLVVQGCGDGCERPEAEPQTGKLERVAGWRLGGDDANISAGRRRVTVRGG